MTEILIPSGLWSEGNSAVIGSWLYADGDAVQEGSIIAEIMVEKTSHDLAAPATGTLRVTVREEQEVSPGQSVGRID